MDKLDRLAQQDALYSDLLNKHASSLIIISEMREERRTTTSVKPDTLPDDSQYKYNRYNSPDRQKNEKKGKGGRNRNYDQGKPATIYQIGATTELSTNDGHRLEFVKELVSPDMAVQVVEFSKGGYKIRKIFA